MCSKTKAIRLESQKVKVRHDDPWPTEFSAELPPSSAGSSTGARCTGGGGGVADGGRPDSGVDDLRRDDCERLCVLPALLRRPLIGRGPDTLRVALMRAAALEDRSFPKLPMRACEAGRPMPRGVRSGGLLDRMLTCDSSRVCASSGTATAEASRVGMRACPSERG